MKLLHLLELLSNYKVEFGKWVKAPKTRFEKLQVRWETLLKVNPAIERLLGP